MIKLVRSGLEKKIQNSEEKVASEEKDVGVVVWNKTV